MANCEVDLSCSRLPIFPLQQDILLDLLDMGTHCLPRLRLIVLFNGGYDGKMGINGSLTPTWVWSDSSRLWLRISSKPGNELFDGVVLRRLTDGKVKFRIGVNAGITALHLLSLLVQELLHSLNIFRVALSAAKVAICGSMSLRSSKIPLTHLFLRSTVGPVARLKIR